VRATNDRLLAPRCFIMAVMLANLESLEVSLRKKSKVIASLLNDARVFEFQQRSVG